MDDRGCLGLAHEQGHGAYRRPELGRQGGRHLQPAGEYAKRRRVKYLEEPYSARPVAGHAYIHALIVVLPVAAKGQMFLRPL